MKNQPVTNLNLLNTDKLLVDDEGKIYIILDAHYNTEYNTCTLKMFQINKDFTLYSVTLPIACDKDLDFVSVNDKDFVFKFTELETTKAEVAEIITNNLK